MPRWNSPEKRTASIHILDDDSLLHVFFLYRPFLLGEDQDDTARLWGGRGGWVRGRWWYELAHVCRRWRTIILGSASYLDLSLVCTNGTPVADMLAHSPPLPLVVDYLENADKPDITAEDEEGIILALTGKQRDRVCRVRLCVSFTKLQRIIVVMDDEYQNLEYLIIMHRDKDNNVVSVFPETLQAPHLRHVALKGFALPMGSRFLTTAVGLVTLCLGMDNLSTYFHPNTLLQWLSFMPELQTLLFTFSIPVPNHDVRWQLAHTPITTPVTLPNLRHLTFQGVSTYLEALVHRVTAPRLEKLEIIFFAQLTFFVPRVPQLLNTAENLRFDSAKFIFSDEGVGVAVYPHEAAEMYPLAILVKCWELDWQLSSMAQISNSLSQTFSAVEHLTFQHEEPIWAFEIHNEIDPTEWRKLLRSFRNVKTLRIDDGFIEELSRCLESDNGELPLELLPELKELTYSGNDDTDDAFTSFIDARHNAGRPISLVRP